MKFRYWPILVALSVFLPERAGAQELNPADYGNVVLSLRADALALADGAAVTEWGPLSAGETTAPAFVASDERFGNRPVVAFDGRTTYMTLGEAGLNVQTVIAAVVVDAGAQADAALLSSGGNEQLIRRNASTTRYRAPGAGADALDFTGGSPAGELSVNDVVRGTFTNSVPHLLVATAGSVQNYSSLWIGNPGTTSGGYWRGAVAELIAFDGELSRESVEAVGWYLQEKYGLPTTFPQPKPLIRTFTAARGTVVSSAGVRSDPGAAVELAWAVERADSVTIDHGALASSAELTGLVAVSPAESTVYTLTATGPGGTSTATILVQTDGDELPVRINELMADNDVTLRDADGDASDWIELYNPNPWGLDLHGLRLVDRGGQWDFPAGSLIEAGGYRLVFASGKNRTDPAGELHASFSLGSSGEYLGLIRIADNTAVSEFSPSFPPLGTDRSYGFAGDPPVPVYFGIPVGEPTPGRANAAEGVAGFLDDSDDTKFAVGRGFFTAPVAETITCSTPGAKIIYTTDGSVPSLTNGTVVEAPDAATPPSVSLVIYPGEAPQGPPVTGIGSIGGVTTLRAAAFRDGFAPTNVDTQTYLFSAEIVRQSTASARARGWPGGSVNGQLLKYAMNPAALADYTETAVVQSLQSLPVVSIVTEQSNLTGSSTGIYVNALQHGQAWERPVSVEFFYPPDWEDPYGNEDGFQIDAGLRIRGGYSRNNQFYKHGLRMYFARRYDGKLRYPMFGSEGTTEFGKLELGVGSNYGWFRESSYGSGRFNTMCRDPFCRDTQGALGQPNTRTRYVHVFLNGIYWGAHYLEERADGDYASSYMGGSDDDYDVVKCGNHVAGFQTEVTNGTLEAWHTLWQKVRTIGTTDAGNDRYFELEGRNPDGSRNPAMPVLLDIDNLIDEMLTIFYSGDGDAVLSGFLGHNQPNNWWGSRRRDGDTGFRFFIRDAEHTLGAPSWVSNQTGPWSGSNQSGFRFSNPQWMHQDLMQNEEYRMRFADRVHRHFFNGGALTPEKCIERFRRRAAQVEAGMMAESVRWGNAQSISGRPTGHPAYYTVDDWYAAIDRVVESIMPNRSTTVVSQLRSSRNGLYPTVSAPVFQNDADGAPQHGGEVAAGFRLRIAADREGTIYYTTDNSDPRAIGGAPAAGARVYDGPLTLTAPGPVRARLLSGTTWSALNAAFFNTDAEPAGPGNLAIAEIHYNPPEGSDTEFVEMVNTGTKTINLDGVSIRIGIDFGFPENFLLEPGARVVIAADPDVFRDRHPTVDNALPAGFRGNLDNSGERLAVVNRSGTTILDFSYSDAAPWPVEPDGSGFSLVLVSPSSNPDPSNASSWRAGTVTGGTPGAAEAGGSGFTGNPAADVDRDGVGAFLEYAFGTSDSDPDDGPDAWSVEIQTIGEGDDAADYLTLTFRRIADPGLTFRVETAAAPDAWEAAAVLVSDQPGPDGTATQTWRTPDPVTAGSRRWIRLRVIGD